MSTFGEQIVALEATRKSLSDRMSEIMQKSADENRSTDTAESAEFDDADTQIKTIDGDLVRLRKMERIQAANAQPVIDKANDVSNNIIRPERSEIQIKTAEKLEPGIAAARYAICLVKAKGNPQVAFELAKRHYPKTEGVVLTLKAVAEGADLGEMRKMQAHGMVQKATVPAGTTTGETWASPLVYQDTWSGDFVDFLRPRTLIGQAAFRPIPFNVRVPGATTGGTGYWVGEGKAKPVTQFGFNDVASSFTKVAAISVITQELARFSDPSAEMIVRDMLSDAVIARADTSLFSDAAAVTGVSPAGLLLGVTPVAGPADMSQDEIICAILRLWAGWDATNLGARPAYYTTPAVARALAWLRDPLGTRAFPGVTMTGGDIGGVPVRVSNYLADLATSGGGHPLILVDEAEVYVADDGSVSLDTSTEASIEMSDTPAGSSSPTVTASGTMLVSLFQTNSLAIRAERPIWWGLRRAGAVAYIEDFPASCTP
jgi:HK97 family phage major capsid protein